MTFCRVAENEDEMMNLLHSKFEFEHITKWRAKALLQIVLCVVANSKSGRKTSHSRKEGFYSGKTKAYGKAFTYTYVTGAIDHVAGSGMLIENRVKPSSHNREQSTLEASPDLIEFCRDVKVKNVERELLNVKDDRDQFGMLEDTDFSQQRRSDLELINTFYADNLCLSFDRKFKTGQRRYSVEGHDFQCQPVSVYCTFNRSSWDCGGRLYCWATNLPREVRPYLLINGKKCVELDFKTFHPSVLFALNGKQIDRDVYSHDGWDRDLCKKAFQALLNGDNIFSAGYSIYENNRDAYGISLIEAQDFVKLIYDKTSEIREYFFTDFGVKLQSLDSKMIVQIIKRCMEKNVPVLTIHDSVLVGEEHESFVSEVMKSVYADFFSGFQCQISKK